MAANQRASERQAASLEGALGVEAGSRSGAVVASPSGGRSSTDLVVASPSGGRSESSTVEASPSGGRSGAVPVVATPSGGRSGSDSVVASPSGGRSGILSSSVVALPSGERSGRSSVVEQPSGEHSGLHLPSAASPSEDSNGQTSRRLSTMAQISEDLDLDLDDSPFGDVSSPLRGNEGVESELSETLESVLLQKAFVLGDPASGVVISDLRPVLQLGKERFERLLPNTIAPWRPTLFQDLSALMQAATKEKLTDLLPTMGEHVRSLGNHDTLVVVWAEQLLTSMSEDAIKTIKGTFPFNVEHDRRTACPVLRLSSVLRVLEQRAYSVATQMAGHIALALMPVGVVADMLDAIQQAHPKAFELLMAGRPETCFQEKGRAIDVRSSLTTQERKHTRIPSESLALKAAKELLERVIPLRRGLPVLTELAKHLMQSPATFPASEREYISGHLKVLVRGKYPYEVVPKSSAELKTVKAEYKGKAGCRHAYDVLIRSMILPALWREEGFLRPLPPVRRNYMEAPPVRSEHPGLLACRGTTGDWASLYRGMTIATLLAHPSVSSSSGPARNQLPAWQALVNIDSKFGFFRGPPRMSQEIIRQRFEIPWVGGTQNQQEDLQRLAQTEFLEPFFRAVVATEWACRYKNYPLNTTEFLAFVASTAEVSGWNRPLASETMTAVPFTPPARGRSPLRLTRTSRRSPSRPRSRSDRGRSRTGSSRRSRSRSPARRRRSPSRRRRSPERRRSANRRRSTHTRRDRSKSREKSQARSRDRTRSRDRQSSRRRSRSPSGRARSRSPSGRARSRSASRSVPPRRPANVDEQRRVIQPPSSQTGSLLRIEIPASAPRARSPSPPPLQAALPLASSVLSLHAPPAPQQPPPVEPAQQVPPLAQPVPEAPLAQPVPPPAQPSPPLPPIEPMLSPPLQLPGMAELLATISALSTKFQSLETAVQKKRRRASPGDDEEEEEEEGSDSESEDSSDSVDLPRTSEPLSKEVMENVSLGRVGPLLSNYAEKDLFVKKWKVPAKLLKDASDETGDKKESFWHTPAKELPRLKIVEAFNKVNYTIPPTKPNVVFSTATLGANIKESPLLTKDEKDFLKTGMLASIQEDTHLMWRNLTLRREALVNSYDVDDLAAFIDNIRDNHPEWWSTLVAEHESASQATRSVASGPWAIGSSLPMRRAIRLQALIGDSAAMHMEAIKQAFRKGHLLTAKALGVQPSTLGTADPEYNVDIGTPQLVQESKDSGILSPPAPYVGTFSQQRGGAPKRKRTRHGAPKKWTKRARGAAAATYSGQTKQGGYGKNRKPASPPVPAVVNKPANTNPANKKGGGGPPPQKKKDAAE